MSNENDEHEAERARRMRRMQKLMAEIQALRDEIYALDDPTNMERYGEYHKRLDDLVNKFMRLQRD